MRFDDQYNSRDYYASRVDPNGWPKVLNSFKIKSLEAVQYILPSMFL